MRIVLLLLLILFLTQSAFSGTTGKIAGQVTDQDSRPIPGASIVIEGTKRGSVTDEEGVFFILSVEPGRHDLIATMIGFDPQRREGVLVTSDFTANQSFQLKEQSIQLGEIVVEAQSGQSGGWSMFSIKATAPPVKLDRTTSIFTVRGEDIEALPILRLAEEFIELQAGVSIDEDGDEISIRAGDAGDVAYYLDGVHMALGLEVFNLFNQKDVRSAPPASIPRPEFVLRDIDFNAELWQLYGIEGLEPTASSEFGTREVHDINNYWDAPRELKFSVRVKW